MIINLVIMIILFIVKIVNLVIILFIVKIMNLEAELLGAHHYAAVAPPGHQAPGSEIFLEYFHNIFGK